MSIECAACLAKPGQPCTMTIEDYRFLFRHGFNENIHRSRKREFIARVTLRLNGGPRK